MNKAITVELQFFLISILWGAILLIVYDILRIIRRLIKHGVIMIALEDLIYWLAAGFFIFSMIYRENNGILRGFSMIGMLLGTVIYHFSISDEVVKIVTKVIQTLLSPLKAALRQVVHFIKFLLNLGKKGINKTLFRLKKVKKSVKISLKTGKR